MPDTAKNSPNALNPQIWVEKYREPLFRYAFYRLQDVDLAEESIQETFLAALQSRKHFQGLASEKSWLTAILKRKIYDQYRRMNRERQYRVADTAKSGMSDTLDYKGLLSVETSGWVCDPARVYDQKEFVMIVKHALSELPNRLAQVFILRYVIELSSPEICEFMGISICNLYVMIHRVRKRLRHQLQLKWFSETGNSDHLKMETRLSKQ